MAGRRNKAIEEQYENLLNEQLELTPTLPSRSIARILCEKYPEYFYNIEQARGLVKSRRSANGNRHREARLRSGKKMHVQLLDNYPEPELHELDPYQIPTGNTKCGLISDIHFPKQCNETIDMALNRFAKEGVDTIILNGDLLDNPTFGKFPVDPNYRSRVGHWFDQTEYFLESLREAFPNALILFAEGNHDAWYRRWLWNHAKNIAADGYYNLQERLHLIDYNIKFIPEIQLIRLADYFIFHGHQHAKGGALDTVAKRLVTKLNSNCIIGHMHYASSFSTTNIMGDNCATVHVLGAASTLKPSYMPFGGKSRKGYAYIEVINGVCQVHNIWNDGGKAKEIVI